MASACGKVILLGEHAVVYGRPALAAGLDRGVEAEFTPSPSAEGVTLDISPWGVIIRPGDHGDLPRGLEALVAAMPEGARDPRGVVRATIHLPGGGGLGSSAALGVAVARAIAPRALTPDETVAAVYAWEKVFHGNPSGIDHAVAAHGGAGLFTKAEGFRPIVLREPVKLLIADTGERARTRDMVESVARQHARKPAAVDKTFDAIEALVRNGALALEANDLRALGQLMDLNQALLSSLLLSTERTEALCAAARSAGAHGAKLTGGGGGGCVVALAGESERAVREAWERAGAPVFGATITSGTG